MDVAATCDRASAEAAIAELGPYRSNAQVRARLGSAFAEHGDPQLLGRFGQTFSAPGIRP